LSTAPEADEPVAYLDHPLDYPPQARRQGQQGRLMLRVQVLADGRCGELELLQSSGYDTLDRAALESVRNWRFVPAQRNGQAYSAWFRVPIRFSLRDA
jgi:protein TonB